MPAVEVTDLVVRYGSTTAVDGLSFTAEEGRVLALLGPNGAGKTTTVETLEGYRKPAGGTARVLALDPIADRRRLVRHIGVMLQQGGIYPAMNAADALRLFAGYYDDPIEPSSLLDRLDLGGVAHTPWRRLSGGEQQRLSLALAIIGRPRVAFLDEPTAGVDPGARLVVRELIAELRSDGVCVVLTTHDLDDAERLADHLVIIDHGRVVAAGTPDDLVHDAAGEALRFSASTGLDIAGLADALGADVEEIRPGEYRVSVAASPAMVARLTTWLAEHNLPLRDLRAGRQSLEDVFLRLTAHDEREAATPPRRGRRR